MKEISALTSLRFFAAFYVFLFHIHIRWNITHNIYISNILNCGAVGMSIFFILSGYILSYRYDKEPQEMDLKRYYQNRFARIYPIYFTAALITTPWIGSSNLAIIVFLLFTNILMIQAWFPQLFHFWNCAGSWSLSAEAFFYGAFPFLRRIIKNLSFKNLAIFTGLTCLSSITPGISTILFTQTFEAYYSLPIYRIPEFIFGICIFELSRNIKSSNYDTPITLITITTFFYLSFSNAHIYITHNWIIVPTIGVVIIFLEKSNSGLIFKFFRSKIFNWLGKISYCFYSFQALLIFVLLEIYGQNSNHKMHIFELFYILSTLIIISAVGYHLIEEPFRKKIRNFNYDRRIQTSSDS